jgi:hypothetical protein
MKYFSLALLLSVAAVVSNAQSVSNETVQQPGVEVTRFSWTKERIGWERDPFGGPIENFDDVRARTRNERRIEDAKRGNSAEVDRIKREARADAANIAAKNQQRTLSRYVFVYKVTVKNLSDKAIKSIDWDYVFFERGTENELGRQQFTNDEKIGPGKSKELSITITKPPTKTISLTALNNSERGVLDSRVILVRIAYADGTTWQLP